MELKDFVKKTILEIATAIHEANNEALNNSLNTIVNPIGLYGGTEFERSCISKNSDENNSRIVEEIKFDVAVTTEKEKKGKSDGAIKIVAASIGTQREYTDKDETVSRISFSIPVALPTGKW